LASEFVASKPGLGAGLTVTTAILAEASSGASAGFAGPLEVIIDVALGDSAAGGILGVPALLVTSGPGLVAELVGVSGAGASILGITALATESHLSEVGAAGLNNVGLELVPGVSALEAALIALVEALSGDTPDEIRSEKGIAALERHVSDLDVAARAVGVALFLADVVVEVEVVGADGDGHVVVEWP